MRKRTIETLREYYLSDPAYQMEIKRALRQFFGVSSPEELERKNISDEGHARFNEWFVFDFHLRNGKSLLQDFYDRNPYQLSQGDLEVYKELQTNEYGMFEALKVYWGRGMDILSLKNGRQYYVSEFRGTFSIKKGVLFFQRVARVADHWELVGADSLGFDIALDQSMRDHLLNLKGKLTPKIINEVYGPYSERSKEKGSDRDDAPSRLDPDEAESRAQALLEELGLSSFVSVRTIQEWTANTQKDPLDFSFLSMLAGLLEGGFDSQDIERLVSVMNDLYNITPQKALDGKSPQEKRDAHHEAKPRLRIAHSEIGATRWLNHYNKGIELMHKKKFAKALEEYNACFELMLQDKTTFQDVYRLFANTGIAHFSLGEEWQGKKLLEMALALNPNYDFAREALLEYEQGTFQPVIQSGFFNKLLQMRGDKAPPFFRWNLDNVRDMSVEALLEQLSAFGVSFSKDDFLQTFWNFISIEDFSKEVLSPLYKGLSEDEDFIWMSGYALFDHFAPDALTVEYLGEAIEKLQALTEKRKRDVKHISGQIALLHQYAKNAPRMLFERWQTSFEFIESIETLKDSCLDLVGTNLQENVLTLVEDICGRVNYPLLNIVTIAVKIASGEPWEKEVSSLCAKAPYDIAPYCDIARILHTKNSASEEAYLLNALEIVKKRDRDKMYDLAYHQTIYGEYAFVIDCLEDFYRDQKNDQKIGELEGLKAEIEKRKEELSFSPQEETRREIFEKLIAKESEKQFRYDPAYLYFEYLKLFKINFTTSGPTTSRITPIGALGGKHNEGGQKSVGRNDPCPCGAKKADGNPIKYKKCHGK